MKKFKFSQAAHLGTVLTAEEMMQIRGNESATIENCSCKLHIAGQSKSENGGRSHQKDDSACKSHCESVCQSHLNCYSSTAIFNPNGFNTGSGSGSGTTSLF